MSAIAESREAPTRLAPPSYFCTCWKVSPSALASVSWFMPSSRRRIRIRPPTCTSIGLGIPVPRPYFGAGFASSSWVDDLFNGPFLSPHAARLQRVRLKRKTHSQIATQCRQRTGRNYAQVEHQSFGLVNLLVTGTDPAAILSAISLNGLVVAVSTADKNQRHKADSQCQCDDDPEAHREPAGEADFRIAEAAPKRSDHDDDRQHGSHGDRDGNPGEDRSVGAPPGHVEIAATLRKSSTNRRISRRRVASSGARSSAAGCTVASA